MIIRIKFSNTKFKIDKFKFLDLISLDPDCSKNWPLSVKIRIRLKDKSGKGSGFFQ